MALLMVLASLALLSSVVVEFAYNSNVTYNLALNDLDRVQAFYLAESGINFTKLILKYDKDAQDLAKQASKKLGKNYQIQPLYQMIPINTQMIRGLAGLTEGDQEGEKKGAASEPGAEGETEQGLAQPSALEQGMAMIDSKAAQDFLDFNGDFAAEVQEEEAKLNLNAFFTISPTQKNYDRLKSVLYHLLATDEFKGLFDDRYRGAQDLAQNIADYIDKDEVHNEPGGEDRGREVVGGKNVEMKNGKLLSLEELAMVPGMTDPVFQKLKEYVTVYGTDEKVWVCRAKDPLVRALIISYTENNPRMEPLKDDNEEMLKKATDAVVNNCPDIDNMSKQLDIALGVSDEVPGDTESQPAPTTTTQSKEGQTTQGIGTPQKSSSQSFGDLVKDKGTVFGITSVGQVGESEVRLVTVVDTSGDAKSWKQLYWRVE